MTPVIAVSFLCNYSLGIVPDSFCVTAVDCVVSPWGVWPPCKSMSCALTVDLEKSIRTRTRSVVTSAKWGGKTCPVLRDTTKCADESCGECIKKKMACVDCALCSVENTQAICTDAATVSIASQQCRIQEMDPDVG